MGSGQSSKGKRGGKCIKSFDIYYIWIYITYGMLKDRYLYDNGDLNGLEHNGLWYIQKIYLYKEVTGNFWSLAHLWF